jgi:hypothetical protein
MAGMAIAITDIVMATATAVGTAVAVIATGANDRYDGTPIAIPIV